MVRIVDLALHIAAVTLLPVTMMLIWSFVTTGGQTKACGCSLMPGPEGSIFINQCIAHQEEAYRRLAIPDWLLSQRLQHQLSLRQSSIAPSNLGRLR